MMMTESIRSAYVRLVELSELVPVRVELVMVETEFIAAPMTSQVHLHSSPCKYNRRMLFEVKL